jgi:hypothetical protein
MQQLRFVKTAVLKCLYGTIYQINVNNANLLNHIIISLKNNVKHALHKVPYGIILQRNVNHAHQINHSST